MTAREIHRLSAIATSWGNGSHLVLPRGWASKRVYCLLQEEWDQVREELKQLKKPMVEVTTDGN